MVLTVESRKLGGRKRFVAVIVSVDDGYQHFITDFSIIPCQIGERDSGRPRISVTRWRSASKTVFEAF
jgi:hypothetical protein